MRRTHINQVLEVTLPNRKTSFASPNGRPQPNQKLESHSLPPFRNHLYWWHYFSPLHFLTQTKLRLIYLRVNRQPKIKKSGPGKEKKVIADFLPFSFLIFVITYSWTTTNWYSKVLVQSLHDAVFQLIQLCEIAGGQFCIEQPIYEQAQQSNGRFMISFSSHTTRCARQSIYKHHAGVFSTSFLSLSHHRRSTKLLMVNNSNDFLNWLSHSIWQPQERER
jgi:hypothetical protein